MNENNKNGLIWPPFVDDDASTLITTVSIVPLWLTLGIKNTDPKLNSKDRDRYG